ncbi:MAG: formate dehydrogenase subunit gamma [Paracoccus sp. (in: a-proteobacteria)]|nr:formate dehydrogenase subunit gamma [Paracoccus sp. (in: a-proteobacteria)]MDO5622293.1 formate dehydrogenase subunit gamma [Paracoccus sp. (in: a-proteobacteria)]
MMARKYSEAGDHLTSRRPVEVSRYRWFTRLNHWIIATTTILLLLSGLAFFHPWLYGLTALFGGGQTARWLHPLLGLVLFVGYTLIFIQLVPRNIPRRDDVVWVKHIRDVMDQNEEKLPTLGKYNAGQKFVFWAMAALIVVLLVTGIMVWQEYFPHIVDINTRRWAMLIHAAAAVAMVMVFIIHVYAAVWTRGTIRAMTRGSVTGGWAWRHHRKWLREVAGRDRAGPAE